MLLGPEFNKQTSYNIINVISNSVYNCNCENWLVNTVRVFIFKI